MRRDDLACSHHKPSQKFCAYALEEIRKLIWSQDTNPLTMQERSICDTGAKKWKQRRKTGLVEARYGCGGPPGAWKTSAKIKVDTTSTRLTCTQRLPIELVLQDFSNHISRIDK